MWRYNCVSLIKLNWNEFVVDVGENRPPQSSNASVKKSTSRRVINLTDMTNLLLPLPSLINPGLQMQKLGDTQTPLSHPPGQCATHLLPELLGSWM